MNMIAHAINYAHVHPEDVAGFALSAIVIVFFVLLERRTRR